MSMTTADLPEDGDAKAHLSQRADAAIPLKRSAQIIRSVIGLLLLGAVGLAGYSVYVALHEPDPQETVVLGQTKLAAGSPAGLRILVRNRVSGKPIRDAQVVLSLRSKLSVVKLGTFRTDATGTLSEALVIPELAPGEYELVLESNSPIGSDKVIKKVEIAHPARVLLSTDKPIYQPGQTIHLRSLALNARTQKPFTNQMVTFEIKDPKGNKVFKEARKSSDFGITSADFALATELNLGRYEIRAEAGATATERTVEVRRYVLPKFKIQLRTEQPYYLPGQTVSGSVQVSYFFGRPVSGGTVQLSAATFQEKPVVLTQIQGRTDEKGEYAFHFSLPDFFVGTPQKNEQAFLDLEAEVRDTAQHAEKTTLSLSVARNELELTAIPEAGALVPGVENRLYIATAYPDGRPAACKVFVNGKAYETDDQGVSEITIGAADTGQQFEIQAVDSARHKARVVYRPEQNVSTPAFVLRTDKAVYQAGENAQVSILSPEERNTVFIDLLKDEQTVLTRSVPLEHHKASYSLTLPPSVVGPLRLNAYVIAQNGEDRGCSRLIFVNPASGLRVTSRLSQEVYRPGDIAKLEVRVTDAEGHASPSALGLVAVDESVFALHENRPGLLQQFLDVEGDLLKPRYQIKSFESPSELLTDVARGQNLAQAYLASLENRPSAPGVDELVQNGYLPPKLIEHAKAMRGTPAYEKLRQNPQYSEVIRLLEGGHGTYSLRELTGPLKQQASEAHRKAYFQKVGQCLQVGFCGLLFLLPVFLLMYYSRPGAGIKGQALRQEQSARYVSLASSASNVLAVLTLLPLLCYPVGFFLLESRETLVTQWILLGFESAVVLSALAVQLLRLSAERALAPELAAVRSFVWAFLIQFVASRAAFALLPFFGGPAEPLIALLFLGSIVAPLVVLGGLGSHIRRQLAAKNIEANVARINFVEVLIILSSIWILCALFLPALARAKARAQSISLLNDLKQLDVARQTAALDAPAAQTSQSSPPRVRRDFPETLLWRPELITDDHGQVTIEIPLADSITTWRASIEGINSGGRLGSAQIPIKVFQDFFVDLDLPMSMSLGDQVSIPVTCYNYLKEPQDIRLTVLGANWFESPAQNLALHLLPNEVKSVAFPLKVLRVGNQALRITAQGTKMSDAVERAVAILPTGQRCEYTRNDILKERWNGTFSVAPETIPDSQSLWVKFYPSRFTEIVEGLDSIFQAPYGCFEQTSSTTYPNVLVLDYLKRMGRLTPEVEVRARKFINAGYQRLLTFEVTGGGFEWFGHSPAHVGLTAYGVLEFTDMSHIHPVDQALIDRTRTWLASKQNENGSWNQREGPHGWSGQAPITAYVAWALAEAGDRSVNLDKALKYLQGHPQELASTYEKALAANAFLAHDRTDAFGRELARQLHEAAVSGKGHTLHWTSTGYGVTYSRGADLDVETSALAAMALIKAGLSPESVAQALRWLSAEKSSCGTWGSTQATVLAMRALLAGSTATLGQEFDSSITLLLNGKAVETFHVNKDNSDVMKQFELTRFLCPGDNRIEFRQTPSGELPFQVAGAYWLPASSAPATGAPIVPEALQIDVAYDRTSLPVDEQLKCDVTVKNQTGAVINMAIVDLGIPPGFDVDTTAFERMQHEETIAKFEVTGNQVILYLREISNRAPFQFDYSLRAKYPLRVQTPTSAVYEYYQPSNRATSKPVILQASDL